MASQAMVDRVVKLAAATTHDPIDSLVSNPKWGTLNFEVARSDLDLLFSLAGHLGGLPIKLVPDGTAQSFATSLDAANLSIQLMREFALEGNSNPTQHRDTIVAQIKTNAEALLLTTQGWIAFLAYQKGDVQRNVEALNAAVVTASTLIETAKADAAIARKELDGVVAAAREASATVGVAHFTSDFSGQAGLLETQAGVWLKWTGGLAIATGVAAAVSFLVPIPASATNAVVVQFMASKLVLLGVLLGATAWCGRTYRALKHQAAVNTHRANALKSFQAFVKATDDPGTRNAVLLETTRSIFSIAPTGYLEGESSGGDAGLKVLEIFKGVTGGTKS